jgi:DNA-binding transcriptional LysR family regulator
MGYELGLFASAAFLDEAGPITTAGDLAGHPQVYYVESMIQVADLDLLERFFPGRSTLIGATSVAAQVSLVKSSAGIGLLPVYLAERDPDLHPVLGELAVTKMTYWLTGRPQNLRRPEVELVADAITLRAATIGS